LIASVASPCTYVYKTVNGCPIRLDIYPAVGVASPVLVCIHGGALIWGSRENIASGGAALLRQLCSEAGYTQVSIDYRLAPETKLPEIVADLRDAWTWVHEELPGLFDVDLNRVAVLGRSAGAYLTLMAGFCVSPRPRALVALYGYGDIVSTWYSEPSSFYRSQGSISDEDAYAVLGTAPLSESPDEDERWRFYLYCRQNGLWIREVAGLDPRRDEGALSQLRPIRNVSPDYPPVLLVHGTADTDVPYHASTDMATALRAQGVEVRLLTIPKGAHAFDEGVTRADLEASSVSPAAGSFRVILDFLGEQLS
jgi:acetyl esterase/lipase